MELKRQASYNDKRIAANLSGLVEPIVRHRILDSLFYKQYLHLTNELTILPVIVQHINFLAGTDAMGRPSPFICCLLRLLELEPSEEVVRMCLDQSQFKYLTALMLVYTRFAWPSSSQPQVYETLERYYPDYRKLRFQLKYPEVVDGRQLRFKISFIDELVHQLLTKERMFDIIMPRLKSRYSLEEAGEIQERVRTQELEIGAGSGPGSGSCSESDDDYESDSD